MTTVFFHTSLIFCVRYYNIHFDTKILFLAENDGIVWNGMDRYFSKYYVYYNINICVSIKISQVRMFVHNHYTTLKCNDGMSYNELDLMIPFRIKRDFPPNCKRRTKINSYYNIKPYYYNLVILSSCLKLTTQ